MMLTLLRVALLAAIATMAAFPATAQLGMVPFTGTLSTGVPLALQVTLSGLDPADSLYAYTFDLAFDPAQFQAVSALDGTIFGPGGLYFTGTIDNVFGNISFHSGLDFNLEFTGTGGLLGTFTLMPLQSATGATISLQNVALQTLDGAFNLENDIDPGTLPTAVLDINAVPEPGTTGLIAAGAAVAAMARIYRRIGVRRKPQL